MKTIGLLGGMSWESTAHYYRLLNQGINKRLGGLHSARIVMVSVDFQPLATHMHQGNWAECSEILVNAARSVEAAGADFLLICTNTMHRLAPAISEAVSIPLLHIADATAKVVTTQGYRTVGLLGTRFTMEEDFYRGRLMSTHGLRVVVPSPQDRILVDRVIFEELCQGIVETGSRGHYLRIMEEMAAQGAEAIIAGCTEIGMLVNQEQTALPLFDTTVIHAEEAVRMAFLEK